MAERLGWYHPEQLILRITLAGSEPKIWRRVEVHSGLTLHDLHMVIQCLFDWDNDHLYQFHAPPGGKLTRQAMSNAIRFHVLPPDPFFGDDPDGHRADEIIIGRVFTPDCKQIVYEYDFGDSWDHIVKLEKRTPGGEQDHIPQCLAGENAAPQDDMGGIYRYYQWLEARDDPSNEMHEQAVEWFPKDFDPADFKLKKANRRLAKSFKPAPKKPGKPRKKAE